MNRIKKIMLAALILAVSTATCFADASTYFSKEVYKEGVQDESVKLLQQSLKISGNFNETELSENFGVKTKEAVIAFQKEQNLDADGIAGSETLDKIIELGFVPKLSESLYKKNMEHHDIRIIQAILHTGGYYSTYEFTNLFDEKTKEAVIAFQTEYGLDPDGIVGKESLNKFVELNWVVEEKPEAVTFDVKPTIIGNLTQSTYKKGDSSPEIEVLQKALDKEGLFNSEDGYSSYFGELTEDAVIKFQTKYSLDADGVAGSGTIAKMKELGYVTQSVALNTNRGATRKYGEYISWSSARKLLPVGTQVTVQDFQTGKSFNLHVGYGTLHADVEPMTADDTKIMKEIWGGEFTWVRRPVLVYYGDRVLAASLNFMPHAGREDKPALEYVSGRSSGFGSGKNYDMIKGNDASGVICLHFKGSKIHANNRSDAKHQSNVRTAAGL